MQKRQLTPTPPLRTRRTLTPTKHYATNFGCCASGICAYCLRVPLRTASRVTQHAIAMVRCMKKHTHARDLTHTLPTNARTRQRRPATFCARFAAQSVVVRALGNI